MDTELIKNAPGFYVDSPKTPEGRGTFYTSIPDEIDTICKIRLTGNAYKLVTLYIGINKTDGSFHPTEVWIYNKTGLYGNSYYRARKQLEELNYISFSVNKDESTKITLNYSVIYKDYDEFMKNRPVPEYFSKRKSKTIKHLDEEQNESKKKQVEKKQTATEDLKAFMATYNPEEDKDFEF